MNTRSLFRASALALLLASTALAGLPARAESPAPIQPTPMATRLPDFSQLVQQVKPAVVSITVHLDAEAEQTAMRDSDSPMPFPFPFAMPHRGAEHVTAKGSGFLIDANGTIVTNNHVVDHAKTVEVTLDDGTTLKAHVLGRDPATDVAVVKVDAGHPLPFLALGDSDKVQPGEWVIAVGNPFGLSGSVTAGIVSARGRDIGNGPYDSFIQVDAPINHGNSGGPLLTQDGKVVGVNTAIFSPSGGSVGIGFAIPSSTVRQVSEQIIATGHVTRGYLGVAIQPVTKAMAAAMHLGDGKGALVAGVTPDSPAAKAGVEPGDVVTALNGTKITDPRLLAQTAAAIPPGTKATLEIIHNGKPQTLTINVANQKLADNGKPDAAESPKTPSLGLALAPLTPDIREQLGLDSDVKGAAIAQVKPNSPAEAAGLQQGDVLLGVNGHAVTTPKAAVTALREAAAGNKPLALRILRDGEPAFVAVDPSATADDSEG